MPRYFFHLRNDIYAPDEEGQDLSGIDAARQHAAVYALDMAAASVLEHHNVNLHHRIQVADETGVIVHSVEFGDVFTVEG